MKTRVANPTLADTIDRLTAAGDPALCRPEGDAIRCRRSRPGRRQTRRYC